MVLHEFMAVFPSLKLGENTHRYYTIFASTVSMCVCVCMCVCAEICYYMLAICFTGRSSVIITVAVDTANQLDQVQLNCTCMFSCRLTLIQLSLLVLAS